MHRPACRGSASSSDVASPDRADARPGGGASHHVQHAPRRLNATVSLPPARLPGARTPPSQPTCSASQPEPPSAATAQQATSHCARAPRADPGPSPGRRCVSTSRGSCRAAPTRPDAVARTVTSSLAPRSTPASSPPPCSSSRGSWQRRHRRPDGSTGRLQPRHFTKDGTSGQFCRRDTHAGFRRLRMPSNYRFSARCESHPQGIVGLLV